MSDPQDDTIMAMESNDAIPHPQDDDDDDTSPVFLDPNDAVEVQVDDENVPMQEENDDDDDEVVVEQQETEIIEMSKAILSSHTGQVYAVAASVNAEDNNTLTIVSGGGDDTAYLHKVPGDNNTSMRLEHAHTDTVACVALNTKYLAPNGQALAAVGAYDGAICIYNAMDGTKLFDLEGPSDVEWLCFHPKGGTVLLAGSVADGTVWMYHLPQKKCLQVFVGHQSGVTAGCFSSNGKWALSASSDGTLRVWAPKTGVSRHVFQFNNDEPAGLTCMAVGGGTDGQLVVVGAEDGMAHVCHVATNKVVASLRHYEVPTQLNNHDDEMMELPMSVEAVGFSPSNPNWCATGGVDGVLKVWDLTHDGGQCRQACRQETAQDSQDRSNNNSNIAGITRLAWHPTMPLVLTAHSNGTLKLWDARNGQVLDTQTGHSDLINDMAVDFLNPDQNGGTIVAVTASDDKTVRVFEINVAECLT